MANIELSERDLHLSIANDANHEKIAEICSALSSLDRIKILKSISLMPKNLSEISKDLGIPISSVARHIDVLVESGLISNYHTPNTKGKKKYSSQKIGSFSLILWATQILEEDTAKEYSVEMPLGLFSHCHITEPCGMNGKKSKLGDFDNPKIFFSPNRVDAELIWFDKGFISYNFPTEPLYHHECNSVQFSFEICSETNHYNNVWPSDITVFINEVEVITFTSPGDFGGRRGKYTPEYWSIANTQFGLLKKVLINQQGVFLDNLFMHDKVKFDDLNLYKGNAVKFTIGIKNDAEHKGGINLFGKNFGDHKQAIIMTVK